MQVQLVFRTEDGDRYELWDSSADFDAHIQEPTLSDDEIFERHGLYWHASREDVDGMVRFVCRPVDRP